MQQPPCVQENTTPGLPICRIHRGFTGFDGDYTQGLAPSRENITQSKIKSRLILL